MVSEEEYVRYVGRYTDMVLRIAVNYCKEYSDAEDITQDVFLKLYETKTDFADSEHIKRWLIRVTVNQCKNYLASAWRRRMQPMEFQKKNQCLRQQVGNCGRMQKHMLFWKQLLHCRGNTALWCICIIMKIIR